MQTVLMTRCSKSDLAALLGVSVLKVERWTAQGLPRGPDGFYTLSQALRWILRGHRIDVERKFLTGRLSQKELVSLLGLSRQAVAVWTRAGLPVGKNGYSLPRVVHWLHGHYRAAAQKEYECRLEAMRKKLCRNLAQCERFLSGKVG